MSNAGEPTIAELDVGECALVLGEDDGEITVRIVASPEIASEGSDAAAVLEFVQALAKRIRKDPDFQEDVLDWYYDHEDDSPAADDDE